MTKTKRPQEDIFFEPSRMTVPRDLPEYFDIFDVKELNNEWHIILHEKEDLIPQTLQGKTDTVLDGFCNPIHNLHGSKGDHLLFTPASMAPLYENIAQSMPPSLMR